MSNNSRLTLRGVYRMPSLRLEVRIILMIVGAFATLADAAEHQRVQQLESVDARAFQLAPAQLSDNGGTDKEPQDAHGARIITAVNIFGGAKGGRDWVFRTNGA